MSIDMAVYMGSFKESTLKQCIHLQVWYGGQAIHFFSLIPAVYYILTMILITMFEYEDPEGRSNGLAGFCIY